MIKWAQNQSLGLRLCLAFAYCAVFYGLFLLLDGTARDALSISFVTVFPVFYGAAVQLVLDPQVQRPFMWPLIWGMAPVLALCIILVVVQIETVICVAILLPIFFIMMSIGLFLMAAVLRRTRVPYDSTTFNASLLLMPVLALPLLGQANFPSATQTVTTQIEIAAPRATVWTHTYTIDTIQDHERVWTTAHNLLRTPQPINATVTGNIRHLRWSDGITFQEHLRAIHPYSALHWDFVFHDTEALRRFDPHVQPQGAIVYLHGGSYTLTDLPNGNTQLRLNTRYTITSPLNAYFALWGDAFLQDFHYAVLSVIKARSESERRNNT